MRPGNSRLYLRIKYSYQLMPAANRWLHVQSSDTFTCVLQSLSLCTVTGRSLLPIVGYATCCQSIASGSLIIGHRFRRLLKAFVILLEVVACSCKSTYIQINLCILLSTCYFIRSRIFRVFAYGRSALRSRTISLALKLKRRVRRRVSGDSESMAYCNDAIKLSIRTVVTAGIEIIYILASVSEMMGWMIVNGQKLGFLENK